MTQGVYWNLTFYRFLTVSYELKCCCNPTANGGRHEVSALFADTFLVMFANLIKDSPYCSVNCKLLCWVYPFRLLYGSTPTEARIQLYVISWWWSHEGTKNKYSHYIFSSPFSSSNFPLTIQPILSFDFLGLVKDEPLIIVDSTS